MNKLPKGWKTILRSNQLTCISKNGAIFECIKHRGGIWTEYQVEAPAPYCTINWDEIKRYARKELNKTQ